MVNVKELRAETGLTQARFAALTGIPKRTIESWEAGVRTPAPWVPKMIAAYLREHGCPSTLKEEE